MTRADLRARTRVRMVVSYNGAPFHGFAIQDDVPTVAGDLTDVLEKVLQQDIEITCAGRTDTGVHAWGQVIHFDVNFSPDELASVGTNHGTVETVSELGTIGTNDTAGMFESTQLSGLRRSVNKLLAPNIVIRDAHIVANDFDARRSAKSRTYRYTILNSEVPDPFLAQTAWHIDTPLELAALRLSCDAIIGEHDFAAFCKKSTNPDATTNRRVLRADWNTNGNMFYFEVTAYAFCHQMVRALVGTMVEMGLGKKTAGDMAWILRSGDRQLAGALAPPQGLCLWNVAY